MAGDRWARCGRVLRSAPFVVSLAVLVLNDRWWKAAWPGVVTGKLSDIAGVVVAAVLVSVVAVAVGAGERRAPVGSSVLVGALFAAMKTSTAGAEAAATGWSRINGGHNVVVADRTDLVALAVLPVVPWIWRRAARPAVMSRTAGASARPVRALLTGVVLVIGIGATTATSCADDSGVVRVDQVGDRLLAIGDDWQTLAYSDDGGAHWTDADWYEPEDDPYATTIETPTTGEQIGSSPTDGSGLSFPGSTVAPDDPTGGGLSFPGSTVAPDDPTGGGMSFPGSTLPADGSSFSFPGSTVAPDGTAPGPTRPVATAAPTSAPPAPPEPGSGFSFPTGDEPLTPSTTPDGRAADEFGTPVEPPGPGYVVPDASRIPEDVPEPSMRVCDRGTCWEVRNGRLEVVQGRDRSVVLEAVTSHGDQCSSGQGKVVSVGRYDAGDHPVVIAAMAGQGIAIRERDGWRRLAVGHTHIDEGFMESWPPPWGFAIAVVAALIAAAVAGAGLERAQPSPPSRPTGGSGAMVTVSVICGLIAAVASLTIYGLPSMIVFVGPGAIALIVGLVCSFVAGRDAARRPEVPAPPRSPV